MRGAPENTAKRVLRPQKGGLRSSLTADLISPTVVTVVHPFVKQLNASIWIGVNKATSW
jgi:hypothetical protein